MKVDARAMEWIRQPKECSISEDKVTITTEPFTDLWQRTYYHFRNDNAPVLQMRSEEQFFSFVVRTDFDTKVRYDQSGIIMYLDSDNWIKASMEYENEKIQRLGSVVTNNGYSDWSSYIRLQCRGFIIYGNIHGYGTDGMQVACSRWTATG